MYSVKLKEIIRKKTSVLCVGLDPNPENFPACFDDKDVIQNTVAYCKTIIEQTLPFAAAFKINAAYFEALGPDGFRAMFEIAKSIPDDVILVADAKRGDVSHTADQYCKAFFEKLNADALTVNTLMGMDTIHPYRNFPDKALYALVLTSNPGAHDFMLQPFGGLPSLSMAISTHLNLERQHSATELGMVIGATNSNYARPVLEACPEAPLLIPGIGAQGGSIDDLIVSLSGHNGLPLVAVSRGICKHDAKSISEFEEKIQKSAQNYQIQLMPLTQNYV